jgi:hypothetical protein
MSTIQQLPGMTITADAPSSGKPPAWWWLVVAAAVGYVLRGR